MNTKLWSKIAGGVGVVLLGFILGATACKKKKPEKFVPIHYQNCSGIIEICLEAGVPTNVFRFDDDAYALPARQWITGDFSVAFNELLESFKAKQWIIQKNDCDNFAQGAEWFAQILHNNSVVEPTALAFGTVVYRAGNMQNTMHKANIAIIFENTYKVIFFEPQTFKEIVMSDIELRSIVECHF